MNRALATLVLLALIACGDAFESASASLSVEDASAEDVRAILHDAALDAAHDALLDAGASADVVAIEASADAAFDVAIDVTIEASTDAALDVGVLDAALDVAHEAEAAPPCTPFAPNTTWSGTAYCSARSIDVPAQYAAGNGSLNGQAGTCAFTSGGLTTPPECRCQETYNCACLKANNGCSGVGQWIACYESQGTAPTVNCQ
jgi:hypothetical protein